MWPRLVPGRCYFATNLLRPRAGDVIVFKNPQNLNQVFVKQVIKKSPEGYYVTGLCRGATSSEQLGAINATLILGWLLG